MENKFLLPFYISLVTVAFIVVSLLVVITKGNPYLIKKKLYFGAMLISLTGVVTGHSGCFCYKRAPADTILINKLDEREIVLNLSVSNSITGKIIIRDLDTFSFAVLDSSGNLIQAGNIIPKDGTFDETEEIFKIGISKNLLPGQYSLRFFNYPIEDIRDYNYCRGMYFLNIVKDK